MKNWLFVTVIIFALHSSAQQLRVRLFSAVPPVQVDIVPLDATFRTCEQCKSAKIDTPLTVTATASVIHYGAGKKAAALRIGGRYRLRSAGTATMELNAPLEIRSVQGVLRIVARMPLEEYVAMAVGGEAGGIKEPEALKAIAVAVRTYAARFRGRHEIDAFDVCDSTHCQVLRLADTNAAWAKAAEDTEGEMLWYEGEPAYAYHHASCGGMLEDGRIMLGRSVPYLRQHADNVCATGSEWDAEIGRDDLKRAMKSAGFHLRTGAGVEITERDRSGRARMLRVDGAPVDATSFRMAIGRELGWNKVRSEMYDVSDQGSSVLFHGRGRGHGVGLCQTGAQLRAQQGANYRDILAFYYPGTTLGVTARGLRWMKMAGERIELQTTSDQGKDVLASAERVLRDAEQRTGWHLQTKPTLRVYPTVAAFRDATGEPGWVAASTVGTIVRMEPLSVLRPKGVLDSTLRHELLHIMVEEHAHAGTPLWFREGLVLWLSGTTPRLLNDETPPAPVELENALQHPFSAQGLRAAYAAAGLRVANLIREHGEATVLQWVSHGTLPPK